MNKNSQVVTIDFHGQLMIAIQNGDQINVAMKPICEAIGIDWNGQFQRIKRHPVMGKGMCVMNIPSEGGEQATATLPLKMLNGWLFGIDAGRVKEESRAKLIEYQTECFDVLANYFLQGIAINPRLQYAVNPGDSLTKEEADTLRGMLECAAKKAHPGDGNKQGAFIRTGWSKLKSHFKVSYRDIPRVEFTEAVSLISRHVIDGEYIPADAAVNPENEAKIDVRELMLSGLGMPSVKLPDDLQRLVDQKAVAMALEAHQLCREHLVCRIAYNAEYGNPRRLDKALAERVIADTDMGSALVQLFRARLDTLASFSNTINLASGELGRIIQSALKPIPA